MDNKLKMDLGKRASKIALIVNISLMLSKAITGYMANSTAIIADAFNNGTDIFATIVVFGGLRIAYLPPDENHHYGHAKAEPIVSKIVGIVIMFTGIVIGWSSLQQILSSGFDIPGSIAIYISLASIFIKYMLYKYTNKVGTKIGSSSIVADSYNHRSDVLASTAALAGIIGARFGFYILDPIAGLIVSIIIFKTGISVYFEAIHELMDTAPDIDTVNGIVETAYNTPGVINVNDIKARKHGGKLRVDLKICVDRNITVHQGHEIASSAKQNIISGNNSIEDIMIHVNPCDEKDRVKKPSCKKCKNNKK